MTDTPKTIRTCEVTQYVEYAPQLQSPELVKHIISKLDYINKWAFIYHDKTEAKPNHIHIMLSFNTPKTFQTIARDFAVGPQYVQKIKSNFANALSYLTHANTPDKEQYQTSDVFTNILDIDKTIEKHRRIKLDDIFEQINKGDCREYNLHKFVNVNDYVKYKQKLDLAFKYYEKANINHDRKMRLVYIFGASGIGKTTLAKKVLNQLRKDFYITSGGKNPFDNYQGQPAILFDEFRDKNMDIEEFLKLTDPFTASMLGTRYKDTAIYCDTMVITSVIPPKFLYQWTIEERNQIFRRLPTLIEIKKGGLEFSVFNSELGDYIPAFNKTININDIEAICKFLMEQQQ